MITTGPRVEEAMERSIRWLDRCIGAHARPTQQNLFAIIQGGLDPELRKTCIDGTVLNPISIFLKTCFNSNLVNCKVEI